MKGQLLISGIGGTWEHFGMKLLRYYTLQMPEPRTKYLEIPGMDGQLDLSEALTGDVEYEQREQIFEFDVEGDFEERKTQIANAILGRAFDYRLSWDMSHLYHGRIIIEEVTDIYPGKGRISLRVISDPWKRAEPVHLEIPAAQGVEAHLPNRRRRVSPTVTCISDTIIGFKNLSWMLEAGTHYLNELVLDPGDNVVFIDSKPRGGLNTWNDVLSKLGQSLTWDQIKDMRWSSLAKYGQNILNDDTSTVVIDYYTYDL